VADTNGIWVFVAGLGNAQSDLKQESFRKSNCQTDSGLGDV
jgi:hypothetical protein